MLSAGQVMLILRHAGLLSTGRVVETARRLQTTAGVASPALQAQLTLAAAMEDATGEDAGDVRDHDAVPASAAGTDWTPPGTNGPDPSIPIAGGPTPAETDDPPTPGESGEPGRRGRDREAEVKELRGWSHLGNLLDPAPALIQLSVTRLKTAFYHFANQVRGSLEAPVTPPSLDQLEQLKAELWAAALGEYGELIDNDLVRSACEAYVADLAAALLLPRHETEFLPRLYQLDGARFVAERVTSHERPFGLLFDQPGMGKTLTTL